MAEFIKYYKLDFAISPLYQEIIPVIYDLFLYVIHLYLDVFPDRIFNELLQRQKCLSKFKLVVQCSQEIMTSPRTSQTTHASLA